MEDMKKEFMCIDKMEAFFAFFKEYPDVKLDKEMAEYFNNFFVSHSPFPRDPNIHYDARKR